MFQNPPFNGVAELGRNQASTSLTSGTATVDTSFTGGVTLQTWLQNVDVTTTPGQMALDTLRVGHRGCDRADAVLACAQRLLRVATR